MKRLYLSLLLSVSLLLLGGCSGTLPSPVAQVDKVDEHLPVIELTRNGLVVEMDEIAFEWKPINDPQVEGIKIYRSKGDAKERYLIATIPNRYSTHYVDLDVKPDTRYSYTFRTYKDDVVSLASKEIEVYSKPPLPSVAWVYARNGLPRMAKLLWRPHSNQSVKYYIVERKTLDQEEWEQIAKLKGRLQAEYIDEGLKDKYTYRYRIRVETFDGIVSTPSEIVKVVTKPLPPQITGLKATTDLPKRIELRWNKSNYKDFERYYLYRSKRKDGDFELIAKLYNNRFTDEVGEDGVKFFYKVSQKDIDGLESKKDDYVVMGATLPKPSAPTISEAKFDGSKITLKWFKVDPRSVEYIVQREAKTGWFDVKVEKFKTKKKYFVDTNLLPNTKYTYVVYAVDANGIVSKPSDEAEVEVTQLKAGAAVAPASSSEATSQKASKQKSEKEETTTQVVSPVDGLDVGVE